MEEQGGLRVALVREAVAMLEGGVTDLSLRAVARAAGVSAMAPYRHFADKAALLGAVAEHGFALLLDALERGDAAADGRAALVGQGLAYVAFATRHPALFRLMFADRGDACQPTGVGDAAYAILARRVALLEPDDAPAATLACWAIVHGLATLALDGRLPSGADPARPALELFASGLVRPGQAAGP
jgi:AcrR family transcriptional regulator